MKIILTILVLLISACHPLEKTVRHKHYNNKPVHSGLKENLDVANTTKSTERKQPEESNTANNTVRMSAPSLYKKNTIEIFMDKWLGTPYRYGGKSKTGIDCSGLSLELYSQVYSKKLERTAELQYKQGRFVKKSFLKEGDLVFFNLDNDRFTIDHVGVYLNNGKFLHASTSKGVTISNMSEHYYSSNYIGARRIN